MVDGIPSFDDVPARMQAKVSGNTVRHQSRLTRACDSRALLQ
jgi:hypothetical protein